MARSKAPRTHPTKHARFWKKQPTPRANDKPTSGGSSRTPTPVEDDDEGPTRDTDVETSATEVEEGKVELGGNGKTRQQAEAELIADLKKQIAEVRATMVELGIPIPGIVTLKLGGKKGKGAKGGGVKKAKGGKAGGGKKRVAKATTKGNMLKLGEEDEGGWRLKAA